MTDVGTLGFYDERGLEAAGSALDTLRSTTNAGFFREEASLHIVFVSDGRDVSPGPRPDYRAWLVGQEDVGEAQAHAIVGIPGSPCGLSDIPGLGYLELTTWTGGSTHDLCQQDWAAHLDQIGLDTIGRKRSFFLAQEADPATIVVTADLPDGTSLTYPASGWSYVPGFSIVTLDGPEGPELGATVRIVYDPIGAASPRGWWTESTLGSKLNLRGDSVTLSPWLVELGPWLVAGSAVLSVGLVVVSAVALPRVLVQLPTDLLLHPPPVRPGGRVLRNAVGWTLILLGVLMLVLPGQGVLTMLAGVVLADVPGKQALLRRLLTRGPVLRAVNAVRAKGDAPPLLIPGATGPDAPNDRDSGP